MFMIDSANARKFMFMSEFVLLAMVWYTVHSVPEVVQTIAYVFGMMFASWSFDYYFTRQ